MPEKPPGHQNRKKENTITSSSIIIPGLEAPGREMNKVSDRPGLGAEPVPVGVKLYFSA